MADWTKTASGLIVPITAVAHPDTVPCNDIDVSSDDAVQLHLYHVLIEEAANTNPGYFAIQGNVGADDLGWADLMILQAPVFTGVTEALTADEPQGEITIAMANTTGFVAGDWVFLYDVSTIANSEWHLIENVVTNTSITIWDPLLVAKENSGGDTAWATADVWSVLVDVHALQMIRVLFIHSGAAGANCVVAVRMSKATAFA